MILAVSYKEVNSSLLGCVATHRISFQPVPTTVSSEDEIAFRVDTFGLTSFMQMSNVFKNARYCQGPVKFMQDLMSSLPSSTFGYMVSFTVIRLTRTYGKPKTAQSLLTNSAKSMPPDTFSKRFEENPDLNSFQKSKSLLIAQPSWWKVICSYTGSSLHDFILGARKIDEDHDILEVLA